MRKVLLLALKSLIVASLLAAALDVDLPSGHLPRTRIYLLDISASVQVPGDTTSLRPEDGWRIIGQDAKNFDRIVVILFGSHPETIFEGSPSELPLTPPKFPIPTSTDPTSALEAALVHDPPDIVLLSDGYGNRNKLEKALLVCASRNIPVHTIALGPRSLTDTRITAIRAPARVAPGKEFVLEVDVLSTMDTSVTLSMTGGASVKADLVRHQPRTLSFSGLRVSGRKRLSLQLSPTDACPENNRAEWIVEPDTNRRKILLLRSTPSGLSSFLKKGNALHLAEADRFKDPLPYDVVILDSFPAGKLTRDQQERLKNFVTKSGGGLLMMGGPGSFASGGYAGTPIEEILPLWAFPDESMSTVILLDRSGSMATNAPGLNRRKLDSAIDAIEKVFSTFRSEDRATIITFAGDRKILGPLGVDGSQILQKLSRERAGGPTALLPAIGEAIRILQETTTPRKSLILLSDGNTEEPTEDFVQLRRDLEQKRIHLLSIHTGEEAGEALQALGNPTPVTHWSELARQISAWMKTSQELIISPSEPSPMLGIPERINRVAVKPAAELLAASGDHPLLAMRPAGRGRTAGATFSFREGWTGSLITPGKTMLQLIDRLSPQPVAPYQLTATVNQDSITIDARGPRTGPIELSIEYEHFPGGMRGKLVLEQVSATAWKKEVPLPEPGVIWYRPEGFRGGSVAVPVPYPVEYSKLGPDREQLKKIAKRTSGRFIQKQSDLEAGSGRKRSWKSGRTLFLSAALLLFLLDIGISAFWRPSRQLRAKKR